jgi:hypothetical protein
MNANHAFRPFASQSFLFEHSTDNRLDRFPITEQHLYAAPTDSGSPGAGGAGGRTEGSPDGTEGGEIRDESGFGAGAGVEDSAAGADQGTNRGVDITEGGTDAGGTDFGANMGTPEDTGGIDVRSLSGGNTGTTVSGGSIPTDPSAGSDALDAEPNLDADSEQDQ